jgi:hypothetical protein
MILLKLYMSSVRILHPLAHEHEAQRADLFLIVALVKLYHTVDGLYMWVCASIQALSWHHITLYPIFAGSWEFVTTLDYEWRVFRGRQRYLWTIWVCS